MKHLNITPLLYAVILFLLIRLTNDLPTGTNYLSHSWQFMTIELTGVTVGCFLCWYLSQKWIKFSVIQHINPVTEYAIVILVPSGLALSIMMLSHDNPLSSEITNLIIPIAVTILMSVLLYSTMKSNHYQILYAESKLHEQEARTAKIESDLRLLRAQFHPHFLFNMLNTIYFTIDENNENARSAVEHLSNLLRSQIYEGEGPVSLERELSALDSYLELSRMRFSDSLEIITNIDRCLTNDYIHPHLLLPMVENAFKHSGGNPRRISINLVKEGCILDFLVENTISLRDKKNENESGSGLTNLRKRLALLYPKRFELITKITDNIYTSHLKLKLL